MLILVGKYSCHGRSLRILQIRLRKFETEGGYIQLCHWRCFCGRHAGVEMYVSFFLAFLSSEHTDRECGNNNKMG